MILKNKMQAIPITQGIEYKELPKHNLCIPGHTIVEKSVAGEKCAVCSCAITGEALKCITCGYAFHHKCIYGIVVPCHGEDAAYVTSGFVNHKHRMTETVTANTAYCQICNGPMNTPSVTALQCLLCGCKCHSKCLKYLNPNCKPFKGITNRCHHFTKGVETGRDCDICGTPALLHANTSLTCSWCDLCVHQCCVKNAPRTCSYGVLSHLIVPPDYINEETETVRYIDSNMPTVIVVNPKSGGRTGASVINYCYRLLNPLQVFNVFDGWDQVFHFVQEYGDQFQMIVAGGDGTLVWAMTECSNNGVNPVIIPVPLGTGNDLANAFGWGSKFDGKQETLIHRFKQIRHGTPLGLDRWNIFAGDSVEFIFNNYFSIGLDAEIVMDFHRQRESNPKKFESALKNKMTYGMSFLNMAPGMRPLEEGVDMTISGVPADVRAFIVVCFLNIKYYAGGTKPWSPVTSKESKYGWRDGSCNDGLLEVFGYTDSSHLVGNVMGIVDSTRIAQTNNAVITVKKDRLNCQCDGEPVILERGVYRIEFCSQSRILYRIK